uniref:hypothetical protein n=2 Tax=Pseudomonadati TaxID=3379134 RepID=UPI00404734F0
MAVLIDFFNIIVPIKTIERKYPGGWNACLNDHKDVLGHTVWHDDHLFRDGAMNSIDFGKIIEFWEGLGFRAFAPEDTDEFEWLDFCVVNAPFYELEKVCLWLNFEIYSVHHAYYDKGKTIGYENIDIDEFMAKMKK